MIPTLDVESVKRAILSRLRDALDVPVYLGRLGQLRHEALYADVFVVASQDPIELELGETYEFVGTVTVDVMSRLMYGLGGESRIVDQIVATLRGSVDGAVKFKNSMVIPGHDFYNRWRTQVTCPWSVELASA